MTNTSSSETVSVRAIAFAGLLSLAAAMGVGRFAFTPVLPLMMREGLLDVPAGSWLAAANYAGYLVGALTAARLRISPGRLGLAALLGTAALTAGMALPAPPLWTLLRFAAGVCSAWAFVATAMWCLGALASRGHQASSSIVYAGVGCGIAIAGLHSLLASSAGASASSLWLQLAALALLMMLPVASVVRRLGPTKVPAHAAPTGTAQVKPDAATGLIACYGIMGFGYILPATFLPTLARRLVDDPSVFGLAWPLFGATAAASTLMAGWWMRRAMRLQVWAVSQMLMGVGVLLPSLWLNGFTIALAALLVGGTFMVITLAGVQEMRARAVGDATALVGRLTAAFAAGQIGGPIASALLLRLPHLGGRGLDVALQVGALSLLASAVWLWRQGPSVNTASKEIANVR